ncbi:MAG: LemA family protein [Chlamydiales bacterium]|nr:LemA family protein [Chlamydiia bacterium]MCP5507904.1 LemA family protein [Chlamydiales bacterium]
MSIRSGMIFLFIAICALYVGGIYNRAAIQQNKIQSQWAQVETQYQRRYDLIPNLVSTSKAYMKHESDVFKGIAEARAEYSRAASPKERMEKTKEIELGLAQLLAIAESYPELRSSETMQALMTELAGTENRISVERKRYNDEVVKYNMSISTFPAHYIAKVFSFSQENYFEAETASTQPVAVNFD